MSVYFQNLDPFVPETQPAASRLVPPTYPPAPPGTAGAGGTDDNRRTQNTLLDALGSIRGQLDAIRFALDTLERIGHDTPLAESCQTVLAATLQLLVLQLSGLRGRLNDEPRQFSAMDTDLQTLRRELLRMAKRGASRQALDESMGVDVFQSVARNEATGQERVPEPIYHFVLPSHSAAARLGLIPPARFLHLILEQLLGVLDTKDTAFSLHAFDTHFTQPFLALSLATRLATRTSDEPHPQFTLRQFGFDPAAHDPEEQLLRRLRDEIGGA